MFSSVRLEQVGHAPRRLTLMGSLVKNSKLLKKVERDRASRHLSPFLEAAQAFGRPGQKDLVLVIW